MLRFDLNSDLMHILPFDQTCMSYKTLRFRFSLFDQNIAKHSLIQPVDLEL